MRAGSRLKTCFAFYRDKLSDEMRKVFSNDCLHTLISDSNIIFNKINLVDVISKRWQSKWVFDNLNFHFSMGFLICNRRKSRPISF